MRNHTEHKRHKTLLETYNECSHLASVAAIFYMPFCLGLTEQRKGMDEYLDEFRTFHRAHFDNQSQEYKELFTNFFVSLVRYNKELNERFD